MHKQEESTFAAFVGIDWADKKHDVCLQVASSAMRERLVLEHRPGAIQAWAEPLRERFGGAPVAVSVELSRGPVVSTLLEHDFFRLFPVQLARRSNQMRPRSSPRTTKETPRPQPCVVIGIVPFIKLLEEVVLAPSAQAFQEVRVGEVPAHPVKTSGRPDDDARRGSSSQRASAVHSYRKRARSIAGRRAKVTATTCTSVYGRDHSDQGDEP